MAFVTQSARVSYDEYPVDEHGELEALVSGVTQTSQSTLLLKKRKEMREVDDAFEFMKEEFRTRMEACDERQREFERRQLGLKDQVTKFEKFIQEGDAKRHRAEMKAKMEARLREQNQEKIEERRRSLRELQRERMQLDSDLDSLRPFHLFLDSTVEHSEGEYDEIPDVLNRYKTLHDANLDLKEVVEARDSENDRMRMELNQLQRETQNAVLVNNSEIHGYQKRLENLREQAYKTDIERENGERFTKDRHRESGQVIMAIKNLHQRCADTQRSKARPLNEREMSAVELLGECLKVVQHRLTDLGSIVEGYEHWREHGSDEHKLGDD